MTMSTGQVMRELGLNRHQVRKLQDTGLLTTSGTSRGGPLFDPGPVSALAARPRAALRHIPLADRSALDVPAALIVHLSTLTADPVTSNARTHSGYLHGAAADLMRWAAWWNVGEENADMFARLRLPLLADVSTVVVHTGRITAWHPHPTEPGVVRFDVDDDPDVARLYARTRCPADRGGKWEIVFTAPPIGIPAPSVPPETLPSWSAASRARPTTWDHQHAVRYEVAIELLLQELAACSARLHREERADAPDAELVRRCREAVDSLALTRARLSMDDTTTVDEVHAHAQERITAWENA